MQTSLIVAALKKMLPIGLNMCSPADQELINLAKIRYSLVIFKYFKKHCSRDFIRDADSKLTYLTERHR